MAETPPPLTQTPPPQTVPQKRPLGVEDRHVPAVASPLNPDTQATQQKKTRDQREKKATYKVRGVSPDPLPSKKSKKSSKDPSVPSPLRYTLPNPKIADFDAPKAPQLVPGLLREGVQFYEATEHISNKRNFRYTRCICDPSFPFSQYHRQSETEPYGPRISFEDTSPHVQFDETMKSITTEKGFRMARTNVGCREGRWYYECKIKSGIRSAAAEPIEQDDRGGGHVRVGWARREASLDGPVGFDAYSYGLRDVGGQKVHMSRPKDFVIPAADFCEGDVVGLEIALPSLSLHRKVVNGVYNKAVDVSDGPDPSSALDYPDTIRDRIPIRYKNHLYFEQFEYHPTKDLEELMNPSQSTAAAGTSGETDPPNPNHPQIPLRTLPFSSIKVYKNGQLLGTPFQDLLVFLPPASKPITTAGAREGLDDGMLGYFPAISVFRGGAVETNFGPDFWYPPPDLSAAGVAPVQQPQPQWQQQEIATDGGDVLMADAPPQPPQQNHDHPNAFHPSDPATSSGSTRLRPMCERFAEQIAEDVLYDIVDEVDFWAQDGGELSQDGQSVKESGTTAAAGRRSSSSAAVAVVAAASATTPAAAGASMIESEAPPPGTVAAATADVAGVAAELKDMIRTEEEA